jgi:hypothetical protein
MVLLTWDFSTSRRHSNGYSGTFIDLVETQQGSQFGAFLQKVRYPCDQVHAPWPFAERSQMVL